MTKRPLLALLAITAACGSASVAAQTQSNFYFVGSLGRSDIEVDAGSVDAYALRNGLTTSSTVTGHSSFAYKAQLGYRFTPAWSLEGGYTSLGKSDYTNTNNVTTIRGEKDADLWNLDIVGTWALGETWSILARFGGYRWEAESDLPTAAGGVRRAKETGYDFKFGAGLQFEVNKNFALRAEYERFNGVGRQSTTGEANVGMYSIGAVLKF